MTTISDNLTVKPRLITDGAQALYFFFIKGIKYKVSCHALYQFHERFYEKNPDAKKKKTIGEEIEKTLNRMLALFKKAAKVERRNNILQIMRHNFETADYYFSGGWIFVLSGNTIKTVYHKGTMGDLYKEEI